jgi:hypothetical protein
LSYHKNIEESNKARLTPTAPLPSSHTTKHKNKSHQQNAFPLHLTNPNVQPHQSTTTKAMKKQERNNNKNKHLNYYNQNHHDKNNQPFNEEARGSLPTRKIGASTSTLTPQTPPLSTEAKPSRRQMTENGRL